MSAHSDAEKAFKEIIRVNAGLTPVTWPNRPGKTSTPRFDVKMFRNPNSRATLGALSAKYSGFIQITYVSELGAGSDAANEEADRVAGWFPADLVMMTPSGRVWITERPSIKNGFSNDVSWITPIDIRYEMTRTT